MLKWILVILANGLEWWKNNQLLQAGKAEKEKDDAEETIKALAARDAVDSTNADRLLTPPGER